METYNCLIADPNANYRMIMFSCIGQYRSVYFNRIQAADPEAAMMKLISEQLDIIFLDVGMPVVGGMSLLEKIIEINPNLFVVLMHDSPTAREVTAASSKGARSFLLKPFNTRKVHETLDLFLKNRREIKDKDYATSISDQTINIVNDFVKTIRVTEKFSKDWEETLKALLMWDILIVEKDQDLANSFLGFLKPFSRSVRIAVNYDEAQDLVKKSLPHLLLLDLTAEDFPGVEFVEQIYNNRLPTLIRPMQIGMVDARSQMDDKLVENGLVGFMSRQFDDLRLKKALLKSYITSNQERIEFQKSSINRFGR